VPAVVAAPLNAPTNVVAVIELFDKLAVSPVLVSSATLPVAALAKIRKLFPVPAATLILSATLARATYKLGTTVVEVTTSGAVPVATLEVSVLATTAPAVFKLPALALPVTVSDVSVPVDVMLGCAAVVTVPAVVALVAAPLRAPTNVVAVMLELPKLALMPVLITALELPFALLVLNVGYTVVAVEVFCNNADAFVAAVAFGTVPVTLAPAIALNPLPLPVNTPVLAVNAEAVTVPLTPNDVNVPTDVILGCAAVVTVPAVVALVAAPLNAPTNVVAVIELFDRLAIRPVLVSSVTLPVAAFAKMRKLFPVPAATLMKSATFA
jgi:hypothetical protein